MDVYRLCFFSENSRRRSGLRADNLSVGLTGREERQVDGKKYQERTFDFEANYNLAMAYGGGAHWQVAHYY